MNLGLAPPFNTVSNVKIYPSAKDAERLLEYLDRLAVVHGWESFEWFRHNGTSEEVFTPVADGSGLAGYPVNVKQFYQRIRDAYAFIGERLFADMETLQWLNGGEWNQPVSEFGEYGKMTSTDWQEIFNQSSTNGIMAWDCISNMRKVGTHFIENTTLNFADSELVQSIAETAWSNYEAAGWQKIFPSNYVANPDIDARSRNSYSSAAATRTTGGSFGTTTYKKITVNYSTDFAYAAKFVGDWNLKSCTGIIPHLTNNLSLYYKMTRSENYSETHKWVYGFVDVDLYNHYVFESPFVRHGAGWTPNHQAVGEAVADAVTGGDFTEIATVPTGAGVTVVTAGDCTEMIEIEPSGKLIFVALIPTIWTDRPEVAGFDSDGNGGTNKSSSILTDSTQIYGSARPYRAGIVGITCDNLTTMRAVHSYTGGFKLPSYCVKPE